MNGDGVRRTGQTGFGAGNTALAEPLGAPAGGTGTTSFQAVGELTEGVSGIAPASRAATAEVSVAVNTWVEQVGQFLGVLQVTLEETRPKEDASAEVRALVGQLPAIIRECRAQVPTPEMIRTWVHTLAAVRPDASERR
jgi:hypothetical protein